MIHTCDGRDPSCVTCARMAEQGDHARTILTASARLDDITRARMWSRITDAIAAPAQHGGSATWRRTGGLVLGALAAAATVILVVRAIRTRGDHDHDLTAAPDTMLTSRLGPHARAALVGPARLEMIGPPGDATTARLHAGTLLAEFEGGPGRSLRIEAGDLVVEIVGTLFAVEVDERAACVAVAHGTVRVTSRGQVQLVTDRQQLCSGEIAPHPIPGAVSDQLARHERSIAVAIAPPTAPSTPTAQPITEPPAPAPVPPAAPAALAPPAPRASSIPAPAETAPRPPTPPAVQAPPAPRASSIAATTAAPPRPPPAPAPSAPRVSSNVVTDIAPAPRPQATPAAPVAPTAPSAPRVAIDVPPPPVEKPAAPAASAPTAETLYHTAEVALAAGDHVAADRALAQILALPGGALADQALYERARIAYQDRAWAAARRHLATLATFPSSPLAEPGRYLDCRIAVQAGDRDAERCFAGYRTAYPRSPHDLDVLAVLVQLAHARAGCAGAQTLRDELITRYPRSDHAAAWRSRCPEVP